jgi:hypothetical protein
MRTLIAFLIVLATALVLLAPVASAQMFTNVYYFEGVHFLLPFGSF